MPPLFSIIIASRNRGELCLRALLSVAQQRCRDWELILVRDGSADSEAYQQSIEKSEIPVKSFVLPDYALGHGPSYARNFGIAGSLGRYICFLDDDDEWIDPGHLSRLEQIIQATSPPPKLLLSKQEAVTADGERRYAGLWLNDLSVGNYSDPITQERLIRHGAFAHLNCSVYERAFLLSLGLFDDRLRYEEDRDLYLRALNRTGSIYLLDHIVARHYVPAGKTNASTSVEDLEKRHYQLLLLDKNLMNCTHPLLWQRLQAEKGTLLRLVSELFAQRKEWHKAYAYARQALASRFGLKWLLYTCLLSSKVIRSSWIRR